MFRSRTELDHFRAKRKVDGKKLLSVSLSLSVELVIGIDNAEKRFVTPGFLPVIGVDGIPVNGTGVTTSRSGSARCVLGFHLNSKEEIEHKYIIYFLKPKVKRQNAGNRFLMLSGTLS